MRKIYLAACATGAFLAGAILANATTFVISGDPVEMYSKAEVDALIAGVATLPIEISDVNGLQVALDGKAATSHTHAQSEVAGLETRLLDDEADIAANAGAIQDLNGDVTAILAAIDARVVISPTAGNDITDIFMGTLAECDAISPKDVNTFYICL